MLPKVDLTIRSNINKGYIPQTLRDQACRNPLRGVRWNRTENISGQRQRPQRSKIVKVRQIH